MGVLNYGVQAWHDSWFVAWSEGMCLGTVRAHVRGQVYMQDVYDYCRFCLDNSASVTVIDKVVKTQEKLEDDRARNKKSKSQSFKEILTSDIKKEKKLLFLYD